MMVRVFQGCSGVLESLPLMRMPAPGLAFNSNSILCILKFISKHREGCEWSPACYEFGNRCLCSFLSLARQKDIPANP